MKQKIKKITKRVTESICGAGAFMILMARQVYADDPDTSAVTAPLNNLKTLLLAIIGAVGIIILAKNVMEFAQAYQQQDSSTMHIAILERKDNGQLFVAMPGYRTREVDENGNRIIRDVCNPITAEFREELYSNILKAYEGIHGENKGEITVGDPAVIPAFTVSVTPYDKSEGSLRGFARVCFDECFVVSNITLVQGKEDIFVSMPNYRTEQHDENGKPVYRDICYPITKDFREKLYGAVYNGFIEALEAKKEQAEPAEKAKKDKPKKAEKEESEKAPTRKSKSK